MLMIKYSNGEVIVTQTTLMNNDSYHLNVTWTLFPLTSEITDVSLYVTTYLRPSNSLFLKRTFLAYWIGIIHGSRPSNSKRKTNGQLSISRRSTITDNFFGFYAEDQEVAYALKFEQLPDWGNVGVLASMQIDAIRFQYNFDKISLDQTVSFAYNVLTLTKNSDIGFQQLSDLNGLFDAKPSTTLQLNSRDYRTFIEANNIKFIIYDKNQLDSKIVNCKLLELVYSNDRYAIFKIKPPVIARAFLKLSIDSTISVSLRKD